MNDTGIRLAYLDGMRGMAALIVVIHHLVLSFYPDYANGNIHYLNSGNTVPLAPFASLWAGNLAVCLFFVLSGFVLAPMTLRTHSYLTTQIVRRLIRLGLPILGSMLLGYVLWRGNLLFHREAGILSGSNGWLPLFFAGTPHLSGVLHDSLLIVLQPVDSSYDPVVWTMHVEYLGSFVIFVIYTLIANRKFRLPVMLVLLMMNLGNYYSDFAAGALLADLQIAERIMRFSPAWRHTLIVFLFMLAAMFGFTSWSAGPGTAWYWVDWLPLHLCGIDVDKSHQLAAIFLLMAVLFSPRAKRLLSLASILMLGRLSFAVYLIHFLIICSLGSYVFVTFYRSLGHQTAFWTGSFAVLAATYGLAVAFTRLIDEPATRLSQHVARKLDHATANTLSSLKQRPMPL